jgi:hypothetical protein
LIEPKPDPQGHEEQGGKEAKNKEIKIDVKYAKTL